VQSAFDTWGLRRNLNGSAATTPIIETLDNKGFTGQEMLDSLALVHLNGRVYDPTVGKFLSADPQVTDPNNGQNYNRYSYVLNFRCRTSAELSGCARN
jgi:RHS repeat-associated protein